MQSEKACLCVFLSLHVFVFCVQDLLQLQYEGVAVMKMFDKAKVNVNLLIFLLNKKFYGKWESKEHRRGKSNRGGRGNRLCLLTVLSMLNKINLKHQMVQDSFVLSDYNLMDHTKMKCCPTKCIRSVFFHVVIVNVMYF